MSTDTNTRTTASSTQPISLMGLLHAAELPAGYRNLDAVPGVRPRAGQIQVRTAGTGHGKTSDMRTLAIAHAAYGPVLMLLNDEPAKYHLAPMGLGRDGHNRDLAGRIKMVEVQSSLRALAEAVYQAVRGAQLGRSLPVSMLLDGGYFGEPGLTEAQTSTSLAHVLEAASRFDLDAIATLTGVSYQDVTGKPAPDLTGMAMAVVVYLAQIKPAQVADDGFTCAASTPTVQRVRGSAELVRVAASVLGLQRRRPYGNPVRSDDHGRRRVSDPQGRFRVLKNRFGGVVDVPMMFDVDPRGLGCRWYDPADHDLVRLLQGEPVALPRRL